MILFMKILKLKILNKKFLLEIKNTDLIIKLVNHKYFNKQKISSQ